MNFLNIGPMELILIFMLALIVLGPRRLPKVARDLGEALSSWEVKRRPTTVVMTMAISTLISLARSSSR